MSLDESIAVAVREYNISGPMLEYLQDHKSEVRGLLREAWNEELAQKVFKEECIEEGRE